MKKFTALLFIVLTIPIFFSQISEISGQEVISPEPDMATDIEWDSSGTLVAVGYYDGRVRLWSDIGVLVDEIHPREQPVIAMAWNDDNNQLLISWDDPFYATYDRPSNLMIWDTQNQTLIAMQHASSSPLSGLEWRESELFTNADSVNNEQTETFWVGDNALQEILGRLSATSPLVISPDNSKRAKGGGVGGDIIIDDLNNSTTGVVIIESSENVWVSSLFWMPDNQHIIAGYANATILIWDITDISQPVAEFLGKSKYPIRLYSDELIYNVILDLGVNDQQILSSVNGSGIIRSWDLSTGELLCQQSLEIANDLPLLDAAFNPQTHQLAYDSGEGYEITLIDPCTSSDE